ncbi:MAG: hypothetical protein JW395_1003 [Nitrospira sp.]|nr:hypothetical protein [Nitrospira sp.]
MQVGDSLVGIHHRHRRPLLVHSLNVGFDGFALILGQSFDLRVEIAKAVVRIHTKLFERLAVFFEHVLIKHRHGMTEDLGIRDLHHGSLHMNREQHALLLGIFDLLLQELPQSLLAHEGGVDDFIGLQCHFRLEHSRLAVLTDELDLRIGRRSHGHGLFVGPEIPTLHMADMRLGVGTPSSHLMGMFSGVSLHGERRTAIGVAFAQNRVDGAALNFVVAGLDVLLFIVFRTLRILGKLIALTLQFLDRFLDLRKRRADVRKLDDIRLRCLGHLAQF